MRHILLDILYILFDQIQRQFLQFNLINLFNVVKNYNKKIPREKTQKSIKK